MLLLPYCITMNNLITEIGYIIIGGALAFIPVYILGLILKQND